MQKEEFNKKYQKHFGLWESRKNERIRWIKKWWWASLVVFTLVSIVYYITANGLVLIFGGVGVTVGLLGVATSYQNSISEGASKLFREYLTRFFPWIHYEKWNHMPLMDFISSDLYPNLVFDRFTGEDLFTNSTKKPHYKFSEVIGSHKFLDNEGKPYYKPILKGMFFRTELKETLDFEVFVFDQTVSKKTIPLNFKLFSTGNKRFDKMFKCYASNVGKAYDLMSPEFTKNLCEAKKIHYEPIHFSFIGGYANAFFESTDNRFEVKRIEKNTKKKIIDYTLQIESCIRLANLMDINHNKP